jgi:hypothetical protein
MGACCVRGRICSESSGREQATLVARLPDECELAFVLLSVADPVFADQDRDCLRLCLARAMAGEPGIRNRVESCLTEGFGIPGAFRPARKKHPRVGLHLAWQRVSSMPPASFSLIYAPQDGYESSDIHLIHLHWLIFCNHLNRMGTGFPL